MRVRREDIRNNYVITEVTLLKKMSFSAGWSTGARIKHTAVLESTCFLLLVMHCEGGRIAH